MSPQRKHAPARSSRRPWPWLLALAIAGAVGLSACGGSDGVQASNDEPLDPVLVQQGQEVFRHWTFGDERQWTDNLRMHEVIEAAVDPATALAVGLKVDAEALPPEVVAGIQAGEVDLADPQTTLALLSLDAVVGVKGQVSTAADGRLKLDRVGITCALCHSTVDDSFSHGIGRRLDGWPNRDLDPGLIISLSPVWSSEEVALLQSWGPGKYDPRFNFDGQSNPVVIPPAFGLRHLTKAIFTGDGDVAHEPAGPVAYWNRYVGVTQMGGQGFFEDERLPWTVDNTEGGTLPDLVTDKLPALQAYQWSMEAPAAPTGSFDAAAAERGAQVFRNQGQCISCHSGRSYSDAERGILHPLTASAAQETDYALRSATKQWRTTPLKGVWQHPPYFHDGSAATLADVVVAYDAKLDLKLSAQEAADLVEFLKSL